MTPNFGQERNITAGISMEHNDYKTYDIGIRFFKEDITNKELNYYISILVLKLQNYINSHWNNYKKLVLYENKLISPYDCVYINILSTLVILLDVFNNAVTKELLFKKWEQLKQIIIAHCLSTLYCNSNNWNISSKLLRSIYLRKIQRDTARYRKSPGCKMVF